LVLFLGLGCWVRGSGWWAGGVIGQRGCVAGLLGAGLLSSAWSELCVWGRESSGVGFIAVWVKPCLLCAGWVVGLLSLWSGWCCSLCCLGLCSFGPTLPRPSYRWSPGSHADGRTPSAVSPWLDHRRLCSLGVCGVGLVADGRYARCHRSHAASGLRHGAARVGV
jgi:hypothetical protein